MKTDLELEIHYADDWAALYQDGELVSRSVGDSYLAEEQALALLGVKQVHDDAFMRGQTQRSGVATTLQEVEEYRASRDQRLAQAQQLRTQASELEATAAALENS